jgi:regulator of nonsense transcripts 2
MDDRPASPDALVVLSSNETLGPSEEAEAEFAKELAKMVSDTGESRKVDKRTALALWDTSALPGGIRKKRPDEAEKLSAEREGEVMKFTLISKKGSKTQVRRLPSPDDPLGYSF